MTFSFRGVLADAAILWRTDRDLMVPIVGMFLLLPILAIAYLSTTIAIAPDAAPEDIRGAVAAFYRANIIAVVAISLTLEFGTLMLLNLYLQRGKSVGELLRVSGLRLLPWVLLAMANGAILQLGFALFILPGVYIFGRTWMMGAAYVAEPERGLLGAIERGFRLSAGYGWWLALLGFGVGAVIFAAVFALVILVQLLAAAFGGGTLVYAVLLVPVAAAGAAAYAFFTLVRIAAYRRLGGSINGM
ncbi:hypothetical protein [Sphingomonas sp.]|jgi:hypothetical protein|uniref:hypothetical protein n=1 Tax=Sphingomonas sp. TaxID=28214 RepID=UPI002E134E75|nr:hypothetical protein [Sphingomonas sp.]